VTEPATTHQSYDPAYFAQLFEVEDRHFWFRSRNRSISAVVGQIVADLPPGYRALEIGCGTGNVLRVLEQTCLAGTVVGMDLFVQGLQYARQRTGCLLVQGDMDRSPFGMQFDVIGLFDVLEHLEDDDRALRSLDKMLAKDGRLLLTVPAHPWLWSYFDEFSHHCRRYRRADLLQKLEAAHLAVEWLTYYMAACLPLLWLGRTVSGLRHKGFKHGTKGSADLAARDLRVTPVVNEILATLLGLESHLLARRNKLPCGTSLLAVARKS
jgi:SAM-dependent methyltransferase